MQDFEKPASFYLGRLRAADAAATSEEPLCYDAKDLTTHAVCVGMTGSGKTGLCISLLEEAALDGVPSIVIDPKGDMGNLMLTFPELRPEDFAPWIDAGEAARKGKSVEEYSADVAASWRSGLAEWGQGPERIARLRAAADVAIYTPGSLTGLPLTVLRSFAAPQDAILGDAELFGDRVQSAVAGVLALVGVDADPLSSREFILLSNILQHAWRERRDVSLADLIREIQQPPFDRLGVLDVESFYPQKERFGLAMQLNNLLASPGFATWLEGDALDVQSLLWTSDGRPRISILSIAHLSDAERMFFVTILLNEVVGWMRTQSGTSSLRAILYMDEIFGFFPPTKEPPSKKPMLTLLKQARAFGLGVVLATQNPVDLDYKGLSNTGTWFLGRLQTERDKQRVLDGLEGALTATGQRFDRGEMDRILSGLGKRVFLLNNVHEDGPVLFQTRWALSYLRGPLTRDQIKALMAPRVAARAAARGAPAAAAGPTSSAPAARAPFAATSERPLLPDGIVERYLPARRALAAGEHWLGRPALLFESRLHYANASAGVDRWTTLATWVELGEGAAYVDWQDARHIEVEELPVLDQYEPPAARFAELPAEACRKESYVSWKAGLERWLYAERTLELWQSKDLKVVSLPHESERDFRARVAQTAREKCDEGLAELRRKYASKLQNAQDAVRKAQERVGQQEEQVSQKKKDTLISTGVSLIGALFGRKLGSRSNVSKLGTAARSAGKISKEMDDVERAGRELEAAREKLRALEERLAEEEQAREDRWHPQNLELGQLVVRPKKSDLAVSQPTLVWQPYAVDAEGLAEPAFELGSERSR